MKSSLRLARLAFPADLAGGFVLPQSQEAGMPEQTRGGPLRKSDLGHETRRDPLNLPGGGRAFGEGTGLPMQRYQALVQQLQGPAIVPGPDLSGIVQRL